ISGPLTSMGGPCRGPPLSTELMLDLKIEGATVIDGTGASGSRVDVGVSGEVVGNCGFSPAPVSAEFREDLRGFALYVSKGMTFEWPTFADYLRAFDADGTALNVVHLVGHGTLRIAAMGVARRAPTSGERTRMQRLMSEAGEA